MTKGMDAKQQEKLVLALQVSEILVGRCTFAGMRIRRNCGRRILREVVQDPMAQIILQDNNGGILKRAELYDSSTKA